MAKKTEYGPGQEFFRWHHGAYRGLNASFKVPNRDKDAYAENQGQPVASMCPAKAAAAK